MTTAKRSRKKAPAAPAGPIPLAITKSSGKYTVRQREVIARAEQLIARLRELGRDPDHLVISEDDAWQLRRRHAEWPKDRESPEETAAAIREFKGRPIFLGNVHLVTLVERL